MAMTMLAALYVYFVLRRPWQQFLVFAASVVFALIGNIARLFSVVLVAKWWSPEIAGDLYHDYSGFVFFPIAVIAMAAFGNFISRDWSHARTRIAKTLTAPDAERRAFLAITQPPSRHGSVASLHRSKPPAPLCRRMDVRRMATRQSMVISMTWGRPVARARLSASARPAVPASRSAAMP